MSPKVATARLRFEQVSTSGSGRTFIWHVLYRRGNEQLGRVYWQTTRSRYAFEAFAVIFDAECLREIAAFLLEKTQEHA